MVIKEIELDILIEHIRIVIDNYYYLLGKSNNGANYKTKLAILDTIYQKIGEVIKND